MSLKMVVDGKLVGDSVFESIMDPSDIRRLAVDRPSVGWLGLVVVNQFVAPQNGRLEFEMSGARVLQIGESEKTFFILENPPNDAARSYALREEVPQTRAGAAASILDIGNAAGDRRFLSALPDPLRATGEKLIAEVRRLYPGNLVYSEKTQRYVQRPDNFWTVKIQRQAGDLAITVRGNPKEFGITNGLTLKQDRPGYSRFKIVRPEQVEKALRIFAQARKRA